jgi:hypothetical protein
MEAEQLRWSFFPSLWGWEWGFGPMGDDGGGGRESRRAEGQSTQGLAGLRLGCSYVIVVVLISGVQLRAGGPCGTRMLRSGRGSVTAWAE